MCLELGEHREEKRLRLRHGQWPEHRALWAWESGRLYFTCDGKTLEGDPCSFVDRFYKSQSSGGFRSLVITFPVCGTMLKPEWKSCWFPARGRGHHSRRETPGAQRHVSQSSPGGYSSF